MVIKRIHWQMVRKLFCLHEGMVTLVTPISLHKKNPKFLCCWVFSIIMKIMNSIFIFNFRKYIRIFHAQKCLKGSAFGMFRSLNFYLNVFFYSFIYLDTNFDIFDQHIILFSYKCI